MGSGKSPTHKETEDIIKVIRFLGNRRVLLKVTIRKTKKEVRGLLKFLATFMKAGLPLMKNVLTPLAKSVLIPLRSIAAAQSNRYSYYKENLWIGGGYTDNLKWRNERYQENSEISWIIRFKDWKDRKWSKRT